MWRVPISGRRPASSGAALAWATACGIWLMRNGSAPWALRFQSCRFRICLPTQGLPMKLPVSLCVAFAFVFGGISSASAGVYADDLGKCLVASTNKDDRSNLIRWLFVAAAHHPAVKPIAAISPAQQDESDKAMGGLIMKLLTDTCKVDAQKAIQYEGPITIQIAFEVLGKVAGQELFSSPEVTANLKGLAKYIDGEKIKALATTPMNPAPAAAEPAQHQ